MHIRSLCLIWMLTPFCHYKTKWLSIELLHNFKWVDMTIHCFTLVITTALLTKQVCETLLVFSANIMLYLCPDEVFVPKYLCFSFYLVSLMAYHLVFHYQSSIVVPFLEGITLSLSTTVHYHILLEQLVFLHADPF